MIRIHKPIYFCLLLLFISACGSPKMQNTADVFSVEGEIRWVGNEPFAKLLLTTDERNSYVLVFDDVAAPTADLGRYRVTGRLYAADWNGARRAHIQVAAINSRSLE